MAINKAVDRRALILGAAGAGLAGSSSATLAIAQSGIAPPPDAPMTFVAADPAIPSIALRWAFSAAVIFADRLTIASPVPRGFVSVKEGQIWGPRLQGRVLPHSGADYYKSTFNTFYMFEASDGALIFIHNRGSKRGFQAKPAPGEAPIPDPNPDPNAAHWVRFRATPVFTAPLGPHDWMNRTVFVANSVKHQNPDRTVFTYYEVL